MRSNVNLLIADVTITRERHEVVDLTWPWIQDASSFLIPAAVIKPFQL